MENRKYPCSRTVFSLVLYLLVPAIVFSGCAPPQKAITDKALVRLQEHPEYRDDLDYAGLEEAVLQSLRYLHRVPEDRVFTFGDETFGRKHMVRSLSVFLKFIRTSPDEQELNEFLQRRYSVYQASGRKGMQDVLFTGYFEPLLHGSLHSSPAFPYPVYGMPSDLSVVDLSLFSEELKGKKIIGRVSGNTFVPYHDREEIENHQVLEDKAPVLAWVKDQVDLFFLHIQGSGQVLLEDGRSIHVHYLAKNGRPYRSIGQLLIDEGAISLEKMSMQAIKEYLANHPGEIPRVLNHNPSYIFFTITYEGPLGALEVKLTPGRSLAVDRSIFPMAGLSFIRLEKPVPGKDESIRKWVPFSRFVLNQDTGGAIKGPGRGDIFWGSGEYAELAAGHLRHEGELYLLVLKQDE